VVTDITGHPTKDDEVNRALVLDVFSCRAVGWSIRHNPRRASPR